jgi:fatty-acyl-CoA synthase
VFGFSTAMSALAGGATCLLEPVFSEEAVLADMARWHATHLVGGDDMVARLAAAWQRSPRHQRDLPAWRWMGIADFTGNARELAAWAQREFGTLTTGVYGSSEVFALAAFWPPGEPVPRRWHGGGRLVTPGTEARIADPDSGRTLPPGRQGELQVRGPIVTDAYLGDTDAAPRAFTGDGWFRTGDLAEIAADGGITYICRMGDMLRLRGYLVSPGEIERRLAEHEGVQVAKVVGIRSAGGAEEAVGFVVPAAGSTTDGETLRAWCGVTLAAFKVPSAVYLIDEMPVTSGTNGRKIRAAALRELAQRYREEERSGSGA